MQVAASVERSLLAASACQLRAHARQLRGRLGMRLRRGECVPAGLAQGAQACRELGRARLASAIGAPECVRGGHEILRGHRCGPEECRRGAAQQALLDLPPGRSVQPAQLVGVERMQRQVRTALQPRDLRERAVCKLLLRVASPGAARGPRPQMALDAHALAAGQHELELPMGVAVGGRRRMVLARRG